MAALFADCPRSRHPAPPSRPKVKNRRLGPWRIPTGCRQNRSTKSRERYCAEFSYCAGQYKIPPHRNERQKNGGKKISSLSFCLHFFAIALQARLRAADKKTRSALPHCERRNGGAERVRTDDPHNAIVVLYQLSYDPINVPKCKNTSALCARLKFSFGRDLLL